MGPALVIVSSDLLYGALALVRDVAGMRQKLMTCLRFHGRPQQLVNN